MGLELSLFELDVLGLHGCLVFVAGLLSQMYDEYSVTVEMNWLLSSFGSSNTLGVVQSYN